MTITRRHVVVATSIIYLLALTILAAYALRSSHIYSLPIADVISALAIALPPLAGIALEVTIQLNEKLAARGQLQTSRIFQLVIAFFLVYEAVLATLAGVHLSPPGSLTCALRERWELLYRGKEEECVRRIQDAFQCCGLASMRDMAWPFPDARHGTDACMVRYEERSGSCLEPWRGEERRVAVVLLVVPVAVFVWKVAIILAPSSGSGWLPSQIRLPRESVSTEASAQRRPRAAIGYRDLEDNNNTESDSLQQEVDRLNNDSRLASHVERSRTKSSGLLDDTARWRE